MQKKLNNKGFTIVEVLIVLAIAGVILATILLAVPALQRNSRNANAKQAATNVIGDITDATSANNGAVPSAASVTSGILTLTVSGATKTYNVPAQITTTSAVAPTNTSTLQIVAGTCNGATAAPAAGSSWAVVYFVEGGTPNTGCVSS
jgi:prepilin-type N-terminal cleavage/methylation domain-containing protein